MGGAVNGRDRLHVAIVSDGTYPWMLGGIQRHTAMLARHMAAAGAEVTLLHTAVTDELRQRAAALEGFAAASLERIRSLVVEPPRSGRYPGHYVDDCRRLSRVLLNRYVEEAVDADFIYAQGYTGMEFTRARRRGYPRLPAVGVHPHGLEMFQVSADWWSWAGAIPMRGPMRRQCLEADCVFSFPGHIRRIVEQQCRVPAGRIVETTNAVDGSWVISDRPLPSRRRTFVFVGRHERRKGMPELIEAIRPLNSCDLEFHFVGPIPEDIRLHRVGIVYHGAVTDTAKLQGILDRGDVLVCPSWSEGMPTVVVEAMARGLAIIGTDVGATSAWVGTDNGVLLPRPDVPGIRHAIERLRTMPPEELYMLQCGSLARVRAATWDAVAAATLRDITAWI